MSAVNTFYNSVYGAPQQTSKAQLDMETFLNLLVVQLANQNPLEPMNDRDFFAQMAQLGQVQGNEKMQSSLERMQASLDLSQAASLMGKTVEALRPGYSSSSTNDLTVTGKVIRLQVIDGNRYLGIQQSDGKVVDVAMDSILEVTA